MKKRVTIISFFVFALILMLLIGLFTRGEGKNAYPFEDESGNVKVEEIELSSGLIVF
jgi:hypothetical protein